ncbi:hypothetical protein, partial [Agromyces sp. NBRC 114283]
IPAHRPQDHITLEMAPLEIRHRSVRPISAKHAQASRFLQQSPRVLDDATALHAVLRRTAGAQFGRYVGVDVPMLGQLAAWHERVVDGTHYNGEDGRGDGATGTVTTAAELHRAAAAFDAASAALREAHAANGVVRWYDDPQ